MLLLRHHPELLLLLTIFTIAHVWSTQFTQIISNETAVKNCTAPKQKKTQAHELNYSVERQLWRKSNLACMLQIRHMCAIDIFYPSKLIFAYMPASNAYCYLCMSFKHKLALHFFVFTPCWCSLQLNNSVCQNNAKMQKLQMAYINTRCYSNIHRPN